MGEVRGGSGVDAVGECPLENMGPQLAIGKGPGATTQAFFDETALPDVAKLASLESSGDPAEHVVENGASASSGSGYRNDFHHRRARLAASSASIMP